MSAEQQRHIELQHMNEYRAANGELVIGYNAMPCRWCKKPVLKSELAEHEETCGES